MSLLRLVLALAGVAIPLAVLASAMRSRATDRWAEGLLVGLYLGVLGAISVVALLTRFGFLP